MLPRDPSRYYKDFPGWSIFLNRSGRNLYATSSEASSAAKVLGIKTRSEYSEKYTLDPRLPGNPRLIYGKSFPGWNLFLSTPPRRQSVDLYPTWREAGSALTNLDIYSKREYFSRYKKDPRLPRHPERTYPDFPGWLMFIWLPAA